jgi:hypothetical protein
LVQPDEVTVQPARLIREPTHAEKQRPTLPALWMTSEFAVSVRCPTVPYWHVS